jgi:hypothetical protein
MCAGGPYGPSGFRRNHPGGARVDCSAKVGGFSAPADDTSARSPGCLTDERFAPATAFSLYETYGLV